MTTTFTPHVSSGDPFSSSGNGICPVRTDLLDQLALLVAHLSWAKRELTSAREIGDQERYASAQCEVERLRFDYSNTRVHLADHRAQHGC